MTRPKTQGRVRYLFLRNPPYYHFLLQETIDKIQDVLPVGAEHTARSATSRVHTEGGYPSYDIGITQEIRAARVAEAGASRVGVIG